MPSNTPSKPQKPNRISALFKRKNQIHPSIDPQQSVPNTKPSSTEDSQDRKRTKARYVEANKILHKLVKECGDQWSGLDFVELNVENVSDSQFKNKIDMVLEGYKNKVNDHTERKIL